MSLHTYAAIKFFRINLGMSLPYCYLIKQLLHYSMYFLLKIFFLSVLHTSASLALNENWDPYVRDDMEMMLNKIVPEVSDAMRTFVSAADRGAPCQSRFLSHAIPYQQ